MGAVSLARVLSPVRYIQPLANDNYETLFCVFYLEMFWERLVSLGIHEYTPLVQCHIGYCGGFENENDTLVFLCVVSSVNNHCTWFYCISKPRIKYNCLQISFSPGQPEQIVGGETGVSITLHYFTRGTRSRISLSLTLDLLLKSQTHKNLPASDLYGPESLKSVLVL
jgi:hypothetical protein